MSCIYLRLALTCPSLGRHIKKNTKFNTERRKTMLKLSCMGIVCCFPLNCYLFYCLLYETQVFNGNIYKHWLSREGICGEMKLNLAATRSITNSNNKQYHTSRCIFCCTLLSYNGERRVSVTERTTFSSAGQRTVLIKVFERRS
jgi:hypothetical protein